MAIPDTNTFKLSDVCDEIGLTGSDRKLSTCFSSADIRYFNSSYEGSKDRLSNFRDYGSHNHNNDPAISISPSNVIFAADATPLTDNTVTVTTYPDAYDYFVLSKPSWVTTSKNNSILTITVSGNSGLERNGVVTVEHNDDSTIRKEIGVEQEEA